MKHLIRRIAAGAALAALLTCTLAPTFAGSSLPQGAVAPAFEGKDFLNTEAVSMRDLRGQVIYYDIFRTT